MIFPFLRGFLSPRRAPAVWFLFALNLVVFVVTYPAYERAQEKLEASLEDSRFLAVQGSLFAQLIEREPQLFKGPSLGAMVRRVRAGDEEVRSLLGTLALRDPQFVAHAPHYAFDGDEIAIAAWREAFVQIRALQDEHPSYRWGLSHLNAAPQNWISYQFAHSGFMHLALNMAFLLLFGAFLETRVGSALVVLGYLLSGLLGAFVFTRLTGLTASPLVGASASISGLGALTAFHLRRERIPFFYLIFPQPGYMGLASFPAWTILLLFTIPDLAGYLSSVSDVSSVAYAAHLGGGLCGALLAGLLHLGWLAPDPYDPDLGWQLFEN